MGRVTVYSCVERRWQWNVEQKRALIGAAFLPASIVAEVARAADMRPKQIYRWRRDLCGERRAGSGFAPVVVGTESRDGAAPPPPAMVVETGGSVVRIAANAPAKLVAAVPRSLAR